MAKLVAKDYHIATQSFHRFRKGGNRVFYCLCQLSDGGFQFTKLGEQIAALTEDMEELKFRKSQLLSRLNCQDSGIVSQDKKVKEMDTFLGKLEQQHITLSEQKENDKQKFLEIRNSIAPENRDAVMAEREAIRPDGKVGLVQKLYAVYKDKYRSEIFDEACKIRFNGTPGSDERCGQFG